jgi:hypothetical protein
MKKDQRQKQYEDESDNPLVSLIVVIVALVLTSLIENL